MKHKQKSVMNKFFIFISFIFIYFYSTSNAQSLVSFNCEEAVDKINNKLIEQTPFIFKSDTTDKESNEIINSLYFVKNNDTIKCSYYQYGTECLDGVYKVKCKNINVYIVYFYEILVGYQYCIIVREDLMEVFKTDIFNVEEKELYDLDLESIDFNKKIIKAKHIYNPNKTQQIEFKEYP